MRYRKRPVVIEAVQFTGLNHDEIADFCFPQIIKVGGSFTLLIPTKEGEMTASKGDWVIKGIQGEFYPCKPDIFEATYAPAQEEKSLNEKILDRQYYNRVLQLQGAIRNAIENLYLIRDVPYANDIAAELQNALK